MDGGSVPGEWYLIVVTPAGRDVYPCGYNPDPDDQAAQLLIAEQVAAVRAAHGFPADDIPPPGWEVQVTNGRPGSPDRPFDATWHDSPPAAG